MDQDFTSLADEKIKIQQESRQWKSQYNTANDELETLKIDYEKLEKQLAFEQSEHEKRRVELKQQELEQKELTDQIKQMRGLKAEYKDLQYEIAGKDDCIGRMRSEIEGLRADLKAENEESKKSS